MSAVVVTDITRPDPDLVRQLGEYGVATVHEAMGRLGLAGPALRPIQQGTRVAGSAVTVLSHPADNLMIHAAVEQCQAGDILVVTTTSPTIDGAFGDLFATALLHRGVVGLVTTTGVRDTADLRQMGFPVWSAAVYAQGTVKNTAGSVNVPIVLAGVAVEPGDIVIADDDGVVVVPQSRAAQTLEAAQAREAKEEADRVVYADGSELSLDRKGLRAQLERLGVTYQTQAEYRGG